MRLLHYRQDTGRLNVVSVTVSGLALILILGFSQSEKGSESSPEAEIAPVALAQALPKQVQPLAVTMTQTARIGSFGSASYLNPVIGQVSSSRWLTSAHNSSDETRGHLEGQPSIHFYGVGFPDIRMPPRPQQTYNQDSNGGNRWHRMITWRQPGDADKPAEPIPYVRCMGLSPQAVAKRADRYHALIVELALEYDVSASLIKAVVTTESCFNHKALSPVGALGLMQLMPDTASWLKVADPQNPRDNLRAGVRYLASLQKQFDSLELALAAYNAGPGNVRRYQGVPPFAETQAYVQKVQAFYRRYVAATRVATR